jgi:chemotaxis protein methyltransferase CheR
MTESEWQDLRTLVHSSAGIKLSEAKRVFLASRLGKRLRATGLGSFRTYFEYLTGSGCEHPESQELVNAVTTNKTEFFREATHFDVLSQWLDSPSPQVRLAKERGLRLWCAAASTGEEPYTIAAVLDAHLSDWEWNGACVMASDIDTAVLRTAHRAVYDEAAVDVVAPLWRSSMFVQGTGDYRDKYRVRKGLRDHVRLFQQNLVASEWHVQGSFDAIFCRNLLIYFDRNTQVQVVQRLLGHLAPHGLLFIGAAESLTGLGLPVQSVNHSVFARAGSGLPTQLGRTTLRAATHPARSRERRPPHFPQQSRRLEPGDFQVLDKDWQFSELHESTLIMIHDKSLRSSLIGHVTLESESDLAKTLGERLVRWHSPSAATARTRQLVAKIVGSSSTVAEAMCGSPAYRAITSLGIHVEAVRRYPTDVRAWIDAAAGRILVSN